LDPCYEGQLRGSDVDPRLQCFDRELRSHCRIRYNVLVRALCIGANPSTSNHRTANCNPTCAEVMHPVHVVLHDIPLVLTMPCPHVLLRRVLVALGS